MTEQIIAFNDSDIKDSFLETSVFKLIIAQHRLDYIKENIEHMKKIINTYKLNIELEDNTLTISTTKHTRDPYAIIKLRDITNLIIKGTPYKKALSAFPDDFVVDCITLRESKSLENRRNRLEGPGGDTLKAIETFTKAELFMSKKCVCVIARSFKALKEVRWIVESVFDGNVHPAYLLKRLMVKRELEKDGEKVGINWEKYLPPVKSKLKNKRGDGKKKKAEKAKKKNENVNE